MKSLQQAQQESHGTGPYRRIWSGPGLSAVQATVYLPSLAAGEIVYGDADDAAFVYSGGWGSGGEAADAGFMHNTGTDTWSLFVKYQGVAEYFGVNQPRLKAGQTVTFLFSVPAEGSLRIETAGEAVSVLSKDDVTDLGKQPVVVQYDGAAGFTPEGAGQILKRMTSVGQVRENLADGTRLSNVAWSAVRFGPSPAELRPWTIEAPGGTLRHTQPVVTVDYVSDDQETVSIFLERTP